MPCDGEILDGPVGHHLGEKTILIRQGLGWRLPPEETGGHDLKIGHGMIPRAIVYLQAKSGSRWERIAR